MEIQQVNESVKKLTENFEAFQEAAKTASKNSDEKFSKRLDDAIEKFTGSLESIQAKQSKLEAAMERPGVVEGDKKDDPATALQKKAFDSYMRHGDLKMLTAEEVKSLSTDENPKGGYLVPVGTLGMINGRVFETSNMRKIADVRTISTKSVTIDLDDDEAEATWEGEGTSSVTDTDTPDVGQLEIVARKITAEPTITEEDLQDSSLDMERWLAGKVADKFSRKENTAFVTGTGKVGPKGFLTYDPWTTNGTYQRNAIEQINNGSTTAIEIDGLLELQGSLIEEYQGNATFAMNRSVLTSIMKSKGTEMYRFLNLQPAVGSSGQALPGVITLLEKPVVLMKDMPVIASGGLCVAYGDFRRGYQIVDRAGISVLVDPYTTKGKVKYRTTKRVGGAVKNFEAIKLLKMATN